ncbi:MAG: glycosyltransferase N-terminal domain-containing protein [Aureibaculum sp.]|nr:glycosyltransferase N-terminal domain-containing protein [Aureibaculum sp.]
MYFLYNITVYIAIFFLKIVAFFNKKIHFFINGRKDVFETLEENFNPNDNIIWFHCASLGEFEQGRPIIEKCKKEYKKYKILVTFFSPSGFEIRKNYDAADLVTYLPLDTRRNVRKFLELTKPKIAIFVKYEFWPNLLKQLKNNGVKTILISGIFRKDQSFFKKYGGWMKRSLFSFDHFFVQNRSSETLLNNIGFTNVTISGDTRFDRVFEITEQNNKLEFIEKFVDNKVTLIAGSTWPKDEELLVSFINSESESNQKFIIAPHNIDQNDIAKLKKSISKEVVLFSECNSENLKNYQVLIIDTIGLLSKIYNYADIAYVGGGFGSGIHNILEPSTFAVPIIIGPNYHKFKEAKDLVKLGACKVINNNSELSTTLNELFANHDNRKRKGKLSRNYILDNIGSTNIIFDYLDKTISKNK